MNQIALQSQSHRHDAASGEMGRKIRKSQTAGRPQPLLSPPQTPDDGCSCSHSAAKQPSLALYTVCATNSTHTDSHFSRPILSREISRTPLCFLSFHVQPYSFVQSMNLTLCYCLYVCASESSIRFLLLFVLRRPFRWRPLFPFPVRSLGLHPPAPPPLLSAVHSSAIPLCVVQGSALEKHSGQPHHRTVTSRRRAETLGADVGAQARVRRSNRQPAAQRSRGTLVRPMPVHSGGWGWGVVEVAVGWVSALGGTQCRVERRSSIAQCAV